MRRQQTVGDVLLEARAPYSHMDEDDSRLFYSTMNALLVYANNRLHVISPKRLRARPGDPCMLYENGGRVSEELWKHRSLVDDFVRENPLGLSERQLEAARPWRHALRDMFTVVDADADRAIYMNQDRLFVVGASQDPADSHVHHIPSLMLLTLVPFKGGIVTSGITLHLSPRPHPWAVPLIARQAAELAVRPLVSTANDLLLYASGVSDDENRVTPRFQREVDESFATGAIA
ncbi:hypothetical protein H7U31_00165 [Olsenella uli]|nr:hypothetical protein [Olsenella uli]